MNTNQGSLEAELYEVLHIAVRLLSESSTPADLAKRVTHALFFKGMCRGVSIYLLDSESNLVRVASYGERSSAPDESVSIWNDSFLASSVHSLNVTFDIGPDSVVCCLPIEEMNVVSGVMLLKFSTDYRPAYLSKESTKLLSKLVGLFLKTAGSLNATEYSELGLTDKAMNRAIQQLTTRQLKILGYIAEGLTNSEISKQVLLSESTVRQETIRIFRQLDCHSRAEAITKARAMGIIDKVPVDVELSPSPNGD